ncbi:MAG TPA: hypothetical protein VGL75_06380 [Acidothermaceae bacterium]
MRPAGLTFAALSIRPRIYDAREDFVRSGLLGLLYEPCGYRFWF